MKFEDLNDVASLIDHTSLKPTDTPKKIETLANEAVQWNFKAVCVNPIYVSLASQLLKGTDIEVATVVGFPLGANAPETKVFETRKAIEDGATEIDMVMNIGQFLAKNYDFIRDEISKIVKASNGKPLKVIIETCYLGEEEIIRASEIAIEAGADFVKTSTGFGTAGAKEEHVRLMKATIGSKGKIKASGGIRSFTDLKRMVKAGADRIGTSSGVKIMQEAREELQAVRK